MSAMPRLELRHITKRFPGVLANDDVSLSIRPGEIHALIGENGAGKSTLVKIIYGVQRADAGQMLWDGQPVSVANPRAARRLGIGMVFQHFSLFEAMSVIENIALGLDEAVPRATLEARVRELLASYSLPLDPAREVHTLSVGERQRIEIVRCLLQSPKLLIMDEPTSVLTPQEAGRLFETLRAIAAKGCAILYISHKLGEVKALCESATILRGGRVVAECDPRAETPRRMAELMIGAQLRDVARDRAALADGPVRLKVDRLTLSPDAAHGIPLRDVSLQLRAGEVLGIAGVAGNGQSELVAALSGERLATSAEVVQLDGKDIGRLGPARRREAGLCAVPEERNGHAAVPNFSLSENGLLTARHRLNLTRRGMIDTGAARDFAGDVIRRFGVRSTGPSAQARSLSGGNLQKFIMGREIGQKPEVFIVAQPTWGVDAGAATTIREAILALAAGGAGVLLISQDLDELLELSDRIAVLNEGRLSQALPTKSLSLSEIGMLMGGVHAASSAGMQGEAVHAP
ncbi:MAG: ABC transporter ATP-binding protein [Bosea sp. (in: a-proteobacteria)]